MIQTRTHKWINVFDMLVYTIPYLLFNDTDTNSYIDDVPPLTNSPLTNIINDDEISN